MLHGNFIVNNTCPKWQMIVLLSMLYSVGIYVIFTIVMILLKMSCSLKDHPNTFLLG